MQWVDTPQSRPNPVSHIMVTHTSLDVMQTNSQLPRPRCDFGPCSPVPSPTCPSWLSQVGTGLANLSSKVMLHLLPAGKVKNFMMGTIISSVMSLLILAPWSSRKKRAVARRSSNLASGMPMQLRDPRPKG